MPRRSAVVALPKEVRAWLDDALAEGGFAQYKLLAAELEKRGHAISKSALHRYGSELERRLALGRELRDKARAVVAATPGDDDAMQAAIMRLTEQHVLEALLALQIDPEAAREGNLEKIVLQVNRLVRAGIPLRNYQREQRERAAATAESVVASAKKAGMSDRTVERIRAQILGIADAPTSGASGAA